VQLCVELKLEHRNADQKYLEIFDIWSWKTVEIIWTDLVKNEEVLHGINEKRKILLTYAK
jgi:hypothetical protein